mgnify:CR=1 FL=1
MLEIDFSSEKMVEDSWNWGEFFGNIALIYFTTKHLLSVWKKINITKLLQHIKFMNDEWWALNTFGRINLFKIGEPECSLSSLLILSSLSTSSMISSLMICKTFLNRPSVFFACQILSEMLKDVLQKRGGNGDQKKIVRIICNWNSFLIEIKISISIEEGIRWLQGHLT